MNKINYAVIGLGWFGEKHCEALAGLPNVELFALCTRRPERLRELARRFGVKHTYTDFRELLANRQVEAGSDSGCSSWGAGKVDMTAYFAHLRSRLDDRTRMPLL